MVKRIILFRFHDYFDICENKLLLLQKLNPNIPIYGFYGGTPSKADAAHEKLDVYFEHFYTLKYRASEWKWQNPDLAYREWFTDVGVGVEFDVVHVIEWDLLLLDSIEKLYQHIDRDRIGLSGLRPISECHDRDWDWITEEPFKSQWEQLRTYVKEKYHYDKEPFGSLGPGLCMPRAFLEKYAKEDIPELVHDELRVPLYGQIFGFKLEDTHFLKNWDDKNEVQYFNCMGESISPNIAKAELEKSNGRRAFHPYRDLFDPTLLDK